MRLCPDPEQHCRDRFFVIWWQEGIFKRRYEAVSKMWCVIHQNGRWLLQPYDMFCMWIRILLVVYEGDIWFTLPEVNWIFGSFAYSDTASQSVGWYDLSIACLGPQLVDCLVDLLIAWVIDWFPGWLIGCLVDWLIDSLIDWLINFLDDWLVDLLNDFVYFYMAGLWLVKSAFHLRLILLYSLPSLSSSNNASIPVNILVSQYFMYPYNCLSSEVSGHFSIAFQNSYWSQLQESNMQQSLKQMPWKIAS